VVVEILEGDHKPFIGVVFVDDNGNATGVEF
jgi:hypothetical protein